jgi:hypothetical protein
MTVILIPSLQLEISQVISMFTVPFDSDTLLTVVAWDVKLYIEIDHQHTVNTSLIVWNLYIH